MRLRLIVFLPVAALIAFLLLISASSFVSALERLITPSTESSPLRVSRYETEYDVLYCEIHALSQAATTCEVQPRCEGSPLLCGEGPSCGSAHDWLEAATRGEGQPTKFVF